MINTTEPSLDLKDRLLWQAMEALSHTIRELGRFKDASNYGDATIVLYKIEDYFGVGEYE